jgi:hypothetical protein
VNPLFPLVDHGIRVAAQEVCVPRVALPITLTQRQRVILDAMTRSRTAEQRLVERARIVTMSADGVLNVEQGRKLGVDHQRIERWRRRWRKVVPDLAAAEERGASDAELHALIEAALDDAVACEKPEECDVPTSRWTPAALATEAVKRGIVASISPRHLDRLLKRGRSTAP